MNMEIYEKCFREVVTLFKIMGYTEDDIRTKYMWVVDEYYNDKIKGNGER